MAKYPVINIPNEILKVDNMLPMYLRENFDEIVRLFKILQVYENTTGVPTNQTVTDNKPVWDRANNITAEGKWLTSKLEGAIETLTNQVNAGAGNVTITDNNGIMIVDNKDAPTKALRLLGGIFAIANSKDALGNWQWKSFGTGDGFTADLMTSGKILTTLVNIVGDKAYTKVSGDGSRVYSKEGELRGHFGWYETLVDQLAAFTRASTAYDEYGVSYASGVPRYPYTALPAPVWYDPFDADQLTTNYTSGGDVAGTPTVSGGVLTYTGGSQATLIKKDLLLQDCEIVVNSDQTDNGGIIARYQDSGNYYLLTLSDDSSGFPTQNFRLFKRVAGAFTLIKAVDLTWPRGTSELIKFTLHGSKLEAYYNGVKVISETDTTFTGGGVGLRNSSATAFRVLDFTVYYAQKGGMSEEGATNIVAAWPTGWTVSGDAGMAAVDQGVQPGAALNTVRLTNSGAAEGLYTSPKSALSPSTTYTIRIKCRGTVAPVKFDIYVLSTTGTLVQHLSRPPYLNSVFQTYSATFTTTADITGTEQYIRFDHNGNDAGYIEIAEVTLIQKAYALTFPGYGATRAAEVMTVPTAGVFTKANWTVKLRFTPTSAFATASRHLWRISIDANNYYAIWITSTGILNARVASGGIFYSITDSTALTVGNSYSIMFSGNGSVIRLCKNGAQIGADTAYVESVGTLSVNMYVACLPDGTQQANGIISDFAAMSRAQTLAEHQTEYNSGLPLQVDEYTTLLMTMNGTLKPTVRKTGLIIKHTATGDYTELTETGLTRHIAERIYTETPTGVANQDDFENGGAWPTGWEYTDCVIQSTTKHGGTYAMQMNERSYARKYVEITKDATFSFWYYETSTSVMPFDLLIDGALTSISPAGLSAWYQYTTTLAKGLHTIEWVVKDWSSGNYTIYIDDIIWESSPVNYSVIGTNPNVYSRDYVNDIYVGTATTFLTFYDTYDAPNTVNVVPQLWIQLPDRFKGKDFQITLALTEVLFSSGYLTKIYLKVVDGSIDKTNARFKVLGYNAFESGGTTIWSGIVFQYIVTV